MDTRPIGVFDSGVGGLTVVKQIMKVMPMKYCIFRGYGARATDGNTKGGRNEIFQAECTVSAEQGSEGDYCCLQYGKLQQLDALRETFDVPIFGVVVPGVEEALRSTKNKKIGVIGTPGRCVPARMSG